LTLRTGNAIYQSKIKTCNDFFRNNAGLGRSPLQHCPAYQPLECIVIDIMGPLPITENGNEYIMVIGDYFTKWKESFALRDHTAQTVADVLITEFICRFGTPRRIHTDQGREFESNLFSELNLTLGISKTRTTPYRPQSDGMVERFIGRRSMTAPNARLICLC
jgi:hypothetical protein